MTNDPKWVRYAGNHARVHQHKPSPEGQEGVPTLGIGAFECDECGKPHVSIAAITPAGLEISILLEPEIAGRAVQTVVEKLGDVGDDYLALRAFRALTLVNALATMTEVEADFLDGAGLKEACRLMVNGGNPALARRYSEDQREAAANVLAGARNEYMRHPGRAETLELVDRIAVELGLTEF